MHDQCDCQKKYGWNNALFGKFSPKSNKNKKKV